jgi:large subunit ribosomal protein L13
MKIYDAENQILGRISSVIAKELLKGEKVVVVNAEKSVLSASREHLFEKYKHKYERGDPIHGPFFPKQPENIFRRTVRGMIPWDKPRGKEAFRNLKVFAGIPEEFAGKTFEKVKNADAEKLKTKYILLEEVTLAMGAKKR